MYKIKSWNKKQKEWTNLSSAWICDTFKNLPDAIAQAKSMHFVNTFAGVFDENDELLGIGRIGNFITNRNMVIYELYQKPNLNLNEGMLVESIELLDNGRYRCTILV